MYCLHFSMLKYSKFTFFSVLRARSYIIYMLFLEMHFLNFILIKYLLYKLK